MVGGQPRLDGHRLAVKVIAAAVWHGGETPKEYADEHDLAPEEVALALRYTEAQRDVIEAAWLEDDLWTEAFLALHSNGGAHISELPAVGERFRALRAAQGFSPRERPTVERILFLP